MNDRHTGSPVRVVMVGAGYFGRFHCDAWIRMPNVEIVAVCDVDAAKARAVAQQYSGPDAAIPVFATVDEALDTVRADVIDIATPHETHLGVIEKAAPFGVDILCIAPFCSDLASAEQALAIAERHKSRIAVHAPVRFQPWYREARRLIEDGALGEPYQVAFRFRPGDGRGPRAYLDRNPTFQTQKRFLVQETGAHWIDMFRMLLGEPVGVFARLTRLNPVLAGEDAGYLLFDFASGARGLFDGNRLSDHAAVNCRLTMGEMKLEGSTGSLRLDGGGRLWRRGFGDIEEREHRYNWRNRQFGGDCVLSCSQAIIEAWQAGKEPSTSGRKFMRVKRIVEKVYESAERGAFVSIKR